MKKLILTSLAALLGAFVVSVQGSIVDPTFNPGAGANGLVESVIPLSDGKILICGNFTAYDGVARPYVARLNHNGSLDTTFSANPGYWVRHMSLQPNGKIVIGGFFTSVDGAPRNRVARLNADGSLDTSFNPGTGATGVLGVSITGNPDPFVFFTALQPDGKILITGNFTNYNGTTIYGIARLNPGGSLDTTFDVGSGLSTWGRSIQVLPNDKILVTGWFDNYHNSGHHRMALINPNGTPDNSFNPFFGDKTAIYTAALLSSGKYIAAGHSVNELGMFKEDIARLNPDGSFDTTFPASADDKVESVRIQADGKILLAGYFNHVNGETRKMIARLNADGTLDPNFSADVNNFIWTIAPGGDGRILVGGGFTSIDGQPRGGIARLLLNSSAPPPPPPPPPGGDTTKPIVRILSPATDVFRVSSSSLTISGTAADANGIQDLSVSVAGGSVVSVTGKTDWSAQLNLVPGTNIVTIRATDPAGNAAIVSRKFFRAESSALTVTINGVGTVSPNLDGQQLVVGRTYRVTARPGAGQIFNGWSGSVESALPTISFVLQPGFQLQANFIPNPFTGFVGSYNGLFTNPGTKAASQAGAIRLTVTPRGTFTGRLQSNGRVYGFTGQFNGGLSSQVTIARRDLPALTLNLRLAGDSVQGTVTDGTFTSQVLAYRILPAVAADLGNLPGRYTMIFPGGPNRPVSGHGFASMLIAGRGTARLQGMMADGSVIGVSTAASTNGLVPLYYSSRGQTIYGWLNVVAPDVGGQLHWEKPAGTQTGSSAIVEDLRVLGSKYVAAATGNLADLVQPVVIIEDGDLTQPIQADFTFVGSQARVTDPNPARIRLNFSRGTGLFTGSFVNPVTQKATVFRGALLQNQKFGGGFFINSQQSGSVFVGETAGGRIPTD